MPGMKERPSVYHLITRMDMGGSAQNTLLTCLGLSRRPYSVTLAHGISQSSSMARPERRLIEKKLELARRSGVTVREIPSLVRRIDPVQDVRALIFIYQVIRRHRYDILHSHTSKAGIIGRWAARFAGVPVIIHTPHGHVFFGHFGKLASNVFLRAEKISDLATDVWIALTAGEKRDYQRLGVGKAGKIQKVHSGVDIRRISDAIVDIRKKREDLGLDVNRPLIGTAGWLLPIKGPDILLLAAARLVLEGYDFQLAFVGKGDMEVQLRKMVGELGLAGKVKFLGWRDDIHEIMHVFDIFVLPSRNEGMGRVIVEAMAAAKPVIASNVGGIPDLVHDGVNGYLFPSEDSEALAGAMARLLKDPDKGKTMGVAGREMAKAYTVEKMVEKIDRIYQEALAAKK